MYIRCGVCQAATWIETLEPGVAELSVACSECEQKYSLLAAGELGTRTDEQYQRAREFAEYNGIDLPSAYSVLLGIMTLADAQSAREQRVKESVEVPSFTEEMPDELPYDEGFHPAVSEGLMSVQQAVDRGDRHALAARIARRHEMPMELAFQVADNRLSLAEARLQRPPRVEVAVSDRPATGSHKLLLFGFAAVIVAAVGFQSWRALHRSAAPPAPVVLADRDATPPVPLDPVAAAVAAATVETDAEGRLLRVAGPDPKTVLIAFCRSTLSARLEPIELTSAVPAFPGTRLGLFRDRDRLELLLAIQIRKDPRTRRWAAGNGKSPIPTHEPPRLPRDAVRIPVSVR